MGKIDTYDLERGFLEELTEKLEKLEVDYEFDDRSNNDEKVYPALVCKIPFKENFLMVIITVDDWRYEESADYFKLEFYVQDPNKKHPSTTLTWLNMPFPRFKEEWDSIIKFLIWDHTGRPHVEPPCEPQFRK